VKDRELHYDSSLRKKPAERGRKYQPASGKPTFAYSFVAGRDETASGFRSPGAVSPKKGDAEDALRKAIEEYQKAR